MSKTLVWLSILAVAAFVLDVIVMWHVARPIPEASLSAKIDAENAALERRMCNVYRGLKAKGYGTDLYFPECER